MMAVTVPFTTRAGELRSLGFDTEDGKNVTLIPYPEIVARLVPYSGVPLSELDAGIQRCILTKSGCTVRVEQQTNPLGPFQPAGESAGSLLAH